MDAVASKVPFPPQGTVTLSFPKVPPGRYSRLAASALGNMVGSPVLARPVRLAVGSLAVDTTYL